MFRTGSANVCARWGTWNSLLERYDSFGSHGERYGNRCDCDFDDKAVCRSSEAKRFVSGFGKIVGDETSQAGLLADRTRGPVVGGSGSTVSALGSRERQLGGLL